MANAHIERLQLHEVVSSLDLRIADGEAISILGASRSHNTRLLRAIAGLEPLDAGSIVIGGSPVQSLPPGRRGVAMVFRDLALYPHLDVEGNIAFPLRAHAKPESDPRDRIDDLAHQFDLHGCLDAIPAELTAAQRVRVAIARALAPRPSLLLIDDALADLSSTERLELRGVLRRLQRSWRLTTLYAASDSIEAMGLADRIAILTNGTLQQIDTPAFLYANPATVAVAQTLGVPRINLLEGSLVGDRLQLADQEIRLPTSPRAGATSDVLVGIRPEAFDVNGERKDAVPAVLDPSSREFFGSHAIVHGRVGDQPVRVRVSGNAADVPRRAYAAAASLLLFRRDSGERLVME